MTKKKQPKTLDDFFDDLKEEHSKDIDESLKAHKEFTKDEHMNHFYNHVFTPAQDALYQAVSEGLEGIGEDATKTVDKQVEIKKAITKGLRAYFDKVQPSISGAIDEHEMNEEEQYDFLSKMYDDHIGANPQKGEGIRAMTELYTKSTRATLGHVKKKLRINQAEHADSALKEMIEKHAAHHFGKYQTPELSKYLKPKVEDAGLEVTDKVRFVRLTTGEMIQVVNALETGNWGKGGYNTYGLDRKEKKK